MSTGKEPLLDVSVSRSSGDANASAASGNNAGGSAPSKTPEDVNEDPALVKAFNFAVKVAGSVNRILPAATFLIFQFFLPLASNGGSCGSGFQDDPVDPYTILTLLLLILFSLISFLLVFTDSVRLTNGKVYHGIVTPWGLWLPRVCHEQLTPRANRTLRTDYRLRLIDVLHAFLSLAIFLASALVRSEVTSCLQLTALVTSDSVIPSLVVNALPLAVGFVASAIYLVIPSGITRRSVDRPMLDRLADTDIDAL